MPESFSLNGKPLKWNEAYAKELMDAHKAFTVFDLSIDNSVDGKEHFARIVSAKASAEFAEAFLTLYDRMLKELLEKERLEQFLTREKKQ
jgi:nitrous oxide reductase accessory protein NosL